MTVDHVSFKVKDLEESFHFYHDILKLPFVRVLGPTDTLAKRMFVGKIELVQIGPEEEWNPSNMGIFSHLALEVENIEKWIEQLQADGVRFIHQFSDTKFDKEKIGAKVAFFRDPNGIPLELIEWRELT
jgi:catechol 2,3-dioxygenase-like lactoylglutathione lyase family enzyme